MIGCLNGLACYLSTLMLVENAAPRQKLERLARVHRKAHGGSAQSAGQRPTAKKFVHGVLREEHRKGKIGVDATGLDEADEMKLAGDSRGSDGCQEILAVCFRSSAARGFKTWA